MVAIAFIGYSDKIEQARSENDSATALRSDPVSEKPDPCFGAPAIRTPGCALRDPAVSLQPSVDDFANDRAKTAEGCYRETGGTLGPCTYGYEGPDAVSIALVGDSHGAQILPALWPLLDKNKWRLTTYLGTGCNLRIPNALDCPVAEIQAKLLEQPPDIVLATALRQGDDPARYVTAWEPLAAAGSRIVVLADNPAISAETYACLTRFSMGADRAGDCSTSREDGFAIPDSLVQAAELVPGTTVIDLTPFYCNDDHCPVVIGNVIVYRDNRGHLTATFARTLAPALEEGLRKALAAPPGKP